MITSEEVTICKMYLDDLDKTHGCNEYKLLMRLLEQQLCEDCVSRKELLDNYNGIETSVGYRKVVDLEVIKNMSSVVPTYKKGKWIFKEDELNRIWDCHCSECTRDPQDYNEGNPYTWLVKSNLPNFCPNCGARMEDEA